MLLDEGVEQRGEDMDCAYKRAEIRREGDCACEIVDEHWTWYMRCDGCGVYGDASDMDREMVMGGEGCERGLNWSFRMVQSKLDHCVDGGECTSEEIT